MFIILNELCFHFHSLNGTHTTGCSQSQILMSILCLALMVCRKVLVESTSLGGEGLSMTAAVQKLQLLKRYEEPHYLH